MKTLRSKHIAINSLFSTTAFIVTAVLGFVIAPITLTKLGTTNYGLWIFITSISSYYSILFLGFGTVVVKHVSEYATVQDKESLEKILGTVMEMFCRIGFFVAIISLVVAILFPYIIDLPPNQFEYQYATLLIGLQFALSFPISLYQAILTGLEKYIIRDSISTGVFCANFCFIFFIPEKYATVLSFACFSFFINISGGVFHYFSSRWFLPKITVSSKNFVSSELAAIFKISIYSFFITISKKVIELSDKIIIGIFLGPIAVAFYSVPQKLVFYLQILLSKAQSPLFPRFINLYSSNDIQSLRKLYCKGFCYSLALSLPICIVYISFGGLFQGLWMGQEFEKMHNVLIVLTFYTFFSQPIIGTFLNSTPLRKTAARWNLLQAILNVVLSIIFIQYWGLIGVAFATLIPSFIIGFLLLNYVVLKKVEISFWQFFSSSVMPIIIPTVITVVFVVVVSRMQINYNMLRFLIMCCLVEFTFVIFFAMCDRNVKELIYKVFRKWRTKYYL